jgi:hypothetical protein
MIEEHKTTFISNNHVKLTVIGKRFLYVISSNILT